MSNNMTPITKKKRVGLLGGTFDPIHLGHLELALQAKEKFQLDQVQFIPAYTSPHKQGMPLTTTFHRLAMLELALKKYPDFSISLSEINRKGVSYTIDTLDLLLETHRTMEIYLIMGADTFLDLGTWKDYRRLTSLCNILVGNRPGFPLVNPQKTIDNLFGEEKNPFRSQSANHKEFSHCDTACKICFFQIAPMKISSQSIRARATSSLPSKKILPAQVDRYIIVNQLYKERLAPPLNE